MIANDIDSFVNSIITYSIENGNSAGCFRIGPQDGVILVSRQLDREKVYFAVFFYTLLPVLFTPTLTDIRLFYHHNGFHHILNFCFNMVG